MSPKSSDNCLHRRKAERDLRGKSIVKKETETEAMYLQTQYYHGWLTDTTS